MRLGHGGLYAGLEELADWRKAPGKRYTLALVLLLVVLAKLCGQAIADLFELPRCVLAHEQATAFQSVTSR